MDKEDVAHICIMKCYSAIKNKEIFIFAMKTYFLVEEVILAHQDAKIF